jgi:hypothetical protein
MPHASLLRDLHRVDVWELLGSAGPQRVKVRITLTI